MRRTFDGRACREAHTERRRVGRLAMIRSLVAASALVVLGSGTALADDTFSRAVYCAAVLKGQIEANRRAMSDVATERNLDAKQRQQRTRVTQQLDQQYTSNFNGLRTYVNSHAIAGDVDKYVSFMIAWKRGEVDIAQCESERDQAGKCRRSCVLNCQPGDIHCIQGCDTQCGAPTCARTHGCNDANLLP
jgi:dsRNA-specific ribonuclease